MTACTAVNDTVVGVAAYLTKDADGDAKTIIAGDKVNFSTWSRLEVNVAMAVIRSPNYWLHYICWY